MIDLTQRSSRKELMDADNIPFPAIAETLKELNIINTRLGGHAITLEGVRQLAAGGRDIVVGEIGCGGGDNLFAVYKYCLQHGMQARFIGVDRNRECITFAQQQYPQLPCTWICKDYAMVNWMDDKPDIIFSSLFCHHFTNTELLGMLNWLQRNSRRGFFINDLHRHWLAYYLIRYITRFFSRSYLVKNDACISVARGFRKSDWYDLFREAGLGEPTVSWRWAFRHLVMFKKA